MKMKINAPSKPRPSYVSRMCEKKWENCQWLWTGSYESFLGGRGAGEGGGENTWVVIGAPTTWRHRKVRETKEDRSSSSGERRGEEKEWKDGKVREEVTALSEPEEGQTLITWTIRWIQADENKKPSKDPSALPAQDHRRALHPAERRGSHWLRFHPDWSPFPAWKTKTNTSSLHWI